MPNNWPVYTTAAIYASTNPSWGTVPSVYITDAAAAATKEQMIAILNGRISEIKKQYSDEFLERVKKMINLRELIESLSPSQEEKLAELWDIALGALQ